VRAYRRPAVSGGLGWLARIAARRVVWILVGLVVYALLNVFDVKAADGDASGSWSGGAGECASSLDGLALVLAQWPAAEGGEVTVTWADAFVDEAPEVDLAVVDGATLQVLVGAIYQGSGELATAGSGGGSFGATTGNVSLVVYVPNPGFTCPTQPVPAGTWSFVAAVSPSPSPGLGCDPYCNVALVQEDRDRLDLANIAATYGWSVSVFLLAAIVVAVGLRR
jgi:hypothetical protein